MPRNAHHWLWVVPVLLLTTILTARLLDASAIWVDEYWTYRTSHGAHFGPATPQNIVESIIVEDPWTMPAYFFAFNMWAGLVGWTPFAVRTLSMLAGVLAVALTYHFGRNLGGHRVGLGAALSLGASAFFIHYTAEIRNYAFMPLLSSFVVWAYWRITHSERPSRLLQAAFALGVALMPYLHYFCVLPLVGIAAYHLLTLFQRANTQVRPYRTIAWWRPALLMAYGTLLFVPWALMITLPILTRVAAEGHQSPHLTWLDMPGLALAFTNGSAVLVLLVGWYLLAHFKENVGSQRSDGVTFVVMATLVAVITGFLINQWRPILLYYRYLIAVFPLLALCAGFGMARMMRSGVRPIVVYGAWLVGGLAAVFNPTFMDAYHNPLINAQPWHRIVPAMQRLLQPGDAATFNMPDEVWYVWQQFSADFYLHDVPLRYIVLDSFPNVPDENYLARVDGFVRESNAPRVWNVYPVTPLPDGLHITERALTDNGYAACDMATELAGYRLELYARAEVPHEVQFDGVGLRLVAPLPAQTGSTLDVTLGIRVGAEVLPETYSISLQVVDAAGTLVRQTDFGVPYAAFSCRHALISDIPAGDYTLNAVVYAWQTQTRVAGTAQATGATGDSLPLGTFHVGG